MTQYVEASPKVRRWFFLIAFLACGLVVFMYRFNVYFPLADNAPEQLIQIKNRALYLFVALALFYLALSAAVIFLAMRTLQTGQWPPKGLALPFRMPIREIKKPYKVWLLVAVLLILYCAQFALGGYKALTIRSIVQPPVVMIGAKP